ncbi:MAG: hypothetical protein ACRCZP_17560 [Phycicoccus sp.]
MATVNYTTRIPVAQTAGEIQRLLGEQGAEAVMIRYVDRAPVGVSFTLPALSEPDRVFALPVDAMAMSASLARQLDAGTLPGSRGFRRAEFVSPEHGARVAWRVVKDWLAAQLALVAAGQARLDQVMLPYLLVGPSPDRTLYQAYAEHGLPAITAGDQP